MRLRARKEDTQARQARIGEHNAKVQVCWHCAELQNENVPDVRGVRGDGHDNREAVASGPTHGE